ncbi:kinesin-like protein KIF14 isoform X1 [Polypterus senegalus]|uniref:kinesin-like protein KIF14 isoform X1 n=1 Tax=Polypterus senegalus TaxID=55291 RepID=UPI001966A442|nr:kinesin-like protein KIF14 isoform X1 [Polypterus senegalus]XP_039591279.1 kinesin-like protein KIF14 isoform X1 [Polypterus senegalus]
MSINATPTRNHTAIFKRVELPKMNQLTDVCKENKDMSVTQYQQSESFKRTESTQKEMNATYVISATKKSGVTVEKSKIEERLMLQKRKMGSKGAPVCMDVTSENEIKVPEKKLSLQRRTRMGFTDKTNEGKEEVTNDKPNEISNLVQPAKSKLAPATNSGVQISSVLVQRSGSFQSPSIKGIVNRAAVRVDSNSREPRGMENSEKCKIESVSRVFSTPTKRATVATPNAKETNEKISKQNSDKGTNLKSRSIERSRTPGQANRQSAILHSKSRTPSQNDRVPVKTLAKNFGPCLQETTQSKRTAGWNLLTQGRDVITSSQGTPGKGVLVNEDLSQQTKTVARDNLKTENSAVTVAVRVRPFNNREKMESAKQVIFVEGEEIIVHHPDSKQSHSFVYDLSFYSFDKSHPNFASQSTVYEKLAQPLLNWAFEGYNTCIFAYGQTGSGKSYTMMGFTDEEGVTPRFCENLFGRMKNSNTKQVTVNLEMSYFEVYNEKIHDLLVVKDESGQKKQPLRVREHPVFGPYVADLSTNVVTSYADIQSWLELGNKQRATAATGMNDKSSRSHSVFTLVMTQTKTEFVEEEEHDHSITSRINLVDLAGSERCSTAQTSGERLKEGVSINKSLLTLGKVISALSEQSQTKKNVFIPYRESVLTWLLKESLGGNSKTAMIATISPAASNVEETLSTLRYARQARMIINNAKVNEDTNAKLIRELKAEVEKLKAAQMNTKDMEPETVKLFKQEIETLKMQLKQQEKEMAEAHRTWREKLDEAEKRKREETKELQKAGVTFQMDNRLPNLVNLNEDPQLSEMLLYMIKEGQTKVGKYKPNSFHDIQLSGVLIADDHCVISNIGGTVRIIPVKDAKTYVNGTLINESTVLHHGDRVILGGDHYFRFNHPVEVQSGKRVSCKMNLQEGQKDFEFARNELLAAQRAVLEAEIEAARLKAKEEMIHGIQVAKEMAQKELSDQKTLFENRIKALEKELEKESKKQKCQELDNKRVISKIEELEKEKTHLELEVNLNKKRLQMEAMATQQALTDHNIRHAKIIEALETEKKKIAEDLKRTQEKLNQKKINGSAQNDQNQWTSMKLSVMIQEANAISRKLGKHTIFSRHEISEKGCENGKELLQVQVQNTKLGITTFWSLEKFESSLAVMRELDQGEVGRKGDDIFYDPADEWEPDISMTSAASSSSSLSRRRSRSLLKSRRISGHLYEIRVHPIQSLYNSQYSGLMSKPSARSSVPESALPKICKDLIGSTIAKLKKCDQTQESIADRAIIDVLTINSGVNNISKCYEQLDEETQENLFAASREAQFHLIQITLSLERLALSIMQWFSNIKSCLCFTSSVAEELHEELRKVGGYLQLLIQGCDSDISSMVKEAHSKINGSLNTTLKLIGHLSAITGTELHVEEWECEAETTFKSTVAVALCEGVKKGVACLYKDLASNSKKIENDVQQMHPGTEIFQAIKKNSLILIASVSSYINHLQQNNIGTSEQEKSDNLETCNLKTLAFIAIKLFRFYEAFFQICKIILAALKGMEHTLQLQRNTEALCLSAKNIDDCIRTTYGLLAHSLPTSTMRDMSSARRNLDSAVKSLTVIYDQLYTDKDLSSTGLVQTFKKQFAASDSSLLHTSVLRSTEHPEAQIDHPASTSPLGIQWV